jgi:hypothetical protein
MSVLQFEAELRHVARLSVKCNAENPLKAAVQTIRGNPAFAQSRLLGRIVSAVASEAGEFRRAEASAFDSETLALVVALMNVHREGTICEADWLEAAKEVAAIYA